MRTMHMLVCLKLNRPVSLATQKLRQEDDRFKVKRVEPCLESPFEELGHSQVWNPCLETSSEGLGGGQGELMTTLCEGLGSVSTHTTVTMVTSYGTSDLFFL